MSLKFKRIVSLRLSAFILAKTETEKRSAFFPRRYQPLSRLYEMKNLFIRIQYYPDRKKMALAGFVRSMEIFFREFIAIEEKLNGSEVLVHVQ